MQRFGAFEGKNNFGKLLELAEAGEEVIITRHGRPVATISGLPTNAEQIEQARAAAARIRASRSQAKDGTLQLGRMEGLSR